MTSFYLNYLLKDPVSQSSYILIYWGLGLKWIWEIHHDRVRTIIIIPNFSWGNRHRDWAPHPDPELTLSRMWAVRAWLQPHMELLARPHHSPQKQVSGHQPFSFLLNFIYQFIYYFWLCWVSLLHGLFSTLWVQCTGFSDCRARALGQGGISSFSTWAH